MFKMKFVNLGCLSTIRADMVMSFKERHILKIKSLVLFDMDSVKRLFWTHVWMMPYDPSQNT